jgi:hypothetical protein
VLLEGKAMADRSLKVFLIAMFGVGGLVILLFTWLVPTALFERIIGATFAVSGWTYAWLLLHRLGAKITKEDGL